MLIKSSWKKRHYVATGIFAVVAVGGSIYARTPAFLLFVIPFAFLFLVDAKFKFRKKKEFSDAEDDVRFIIPCLIPAMAERRGPERYAFTVQVRDDYVKHEFIIEPEDVIVGDPLGVFFEHYLVLTGDKGTCEYCDNPKWRPAYFMSQIPPNGMWWHKNLAGDISMPCKKVRGTFAACKCGWTSTAENGSEIAEDWKKHVREREALRRKTLQ